jgi:hypothetical protein
MIELKFRADEKLMASRTLWITCRIDSFSSVSRDDSVYAIITIDCVLFGRYMYCLFPISFPVVLLFVCIIVCVWLSTLQTSSRPSVFCSCGSDAKPAVVFEIVA